MELYFEIYLFVGCSGSLGQIVFGTWTQLLIIWGHQRGLAVSLAGQLWSPVACFGRGFAKRRPGTSSWSTRASPARTSASSSVTQPQAVPPSLTSNRARRKTESASSSETAMASSPAAQTVSGLIIWSTLSLFIYSFIPVDPSCPESRSASLLAKRSLQNLKNQASLVH